jgi:phosphate transport system permease protein
VSGNLLAAARGVGETAPLLFTIAAPTLAMTLFIFTQATQAYPGAQQTAWAAALVLLAAVLCLSIAARAAAWALTRKAR